MLLTSVKLGAVVKAGDESLALLGGSDHVLLVSEYPDPLNTGKKITRANLFLGKMNFEDGFWDLENSSADYMGTFEHYEQAKTTSKTGGYYEVPGVFESWVPEAEVINFGEAETAVFYTNDTEFKRPLLDEGSYEHKRTALFRYSSFGEFDRVLQNLDKSQNSLPLTSDRSVFEEHGLHSLFKSNWWETLLEDQRQLTNSPPDGDLKVTGKMEVGQTINVDAGSITDADGIDSDFSHSWQVFDGDTDTWLDRTNPDATDGDASYTLTNDDEDELLRAQVSYVDGNGLTEIISSEPFFVDSVDLASNTYQSVVTGFEEIAYRPGGSINIPLIYNVNTGDANLSGLTLNVHYDSTLLAPEGADDGVTGMIEAAISTTADLPDVDDLDNDPITDRMVQLVWATFDNSFPDQDLPLQLATISFESLEDSSVPVDSLTGSRINFTASGTASGYDFLSSSTTLTPRGFDLDVDGDGEVTALGDGLMIIRKLFGPAFAGDKLTEKAISPEATRTTEEIHQFIQDGINAGDLDVDQDGDTTALGDGLMVIRRLFGPAFGGDKLIEKAISPDSPFHEQLEPAAWVGYEIDKLNPILPEVVAPQNPITAPEYGVGIGDDPIVLPLYGVGIGISDPSQLSPTA